MQTIATSDLYEASYYLCMGGKVTNLETFRENKKYICTFHITGENIVKAQSDYFNLKANINLTQFRSHYNHVVNLANNAVREAKRNQDSLKKEALQ